MACLAAAERVEFGLVRDTVEVSDSVLSKQMTVLAEAGYVRVVKGYVGKRPRTWLALTSTGRYAFEAHLGALTAIAAMPARPTVTIAAAPSSTPPERTSAPPGRNTSADV